MAEPARKVARQAEARLDEVAATVREKFDRITGSRFAGRPGRPVEPNPATPGPEVRRADRTGGKPR